MVRCDRPGPALAQTEETEEQETGRGGSSQTTAASWVPLAGFVLLLSEQSSLCAWALARSGFSPTRLLIHCVILGRFGNFFEPQFPHLQHSG